MSRFLTSDFFRDRSKSSSFARLLLDDGTLDTFSIDSILENAIYQQAFTGPENLTVPCPADFDIFTDDEDASVEHKLDSRFLVKGIVQGYPKGVRRAIVLLEMMGDSFYAAVANPTLTFKSETCLT